MAAEDGDKEMKEFLVSIFRETNDVGGLTVKFLRNKFLEKLGKASLEPDRKERFKEIVHDTFHNFSSLEQGSIYKSQTASTFEKVSSEDKEGSSKSQDESEDNDSDATENHSPRKKKQRLQTIDDESSGEEGEEKVSIYARDKTEFKLEKNSENGSESQTVSENKLHSTKSMQNGKVRKPFKEKIINEEIEDNGSDENSGNDENKFDTSRVDNSSQCKSSDGEKFNIKRKSSENIRSRKRQDKKNKKSLGNSNSSDEDSAKESLANESNHQEPEGDCDFNMHLEKCSQSDNTDVSEHGDGSNGDLSCNTVSNRGQDSDHESHSSKEDKENKMVKNTEKSSKKRQRTKSPEKHRKSSSEAGESAKLRILKKYLRTCGLHIKKYATLFEDCRSMAAKERKLESYIRDNVEIEGRITLEKCKNARQVKEKAKELAELDTTNIIIDDTGRRPRRTCHLWCSDSKPVRKPASPNRDKKIFSRLKGIVDSDSESDSQDKETTNGIYDKSSWKETAVDAKRRQIMLIDSDSDDY